MNEMKRYKERLLHITEHGPDRVLIDAQGTAVPFKDVKEALPELVFIRKGDMWSLGCSRKLAEAAYALWKDQWLACVAYISGKSTDAEKPMLALLDRWDEQPGVLPSDLPELLVTAGALFAAQPVSLGIMGMARRFTTICDKWAGSLGPEPTDGGPLGPWLAIAAIVGAAGVFHAAGEAWFRQQHPPEPPQFLPSVN